MTTWDKVQKVHLDHPDWTAPMIAEHLGCRASYVRATAQRRGMRLPRAIPRKFNPDNQPISQVLTASERIAILSRRIANLKRGAGEYTDYERERNIKTAEDALAFAYQDLGA